MGITTPQKPGREEYHQCNKKHIQGTDNHNNVKICACFFVKICML